MLRNSPHVCYRFRNHSLTAMRQQQYRAASWNSVDPNIWIKEVYTRSLKTVSINPWINRKVLEQRKQALSHIFDVNVYRLWFNGFFMKLWNSQRGVSDCNWTRTHNHLVRKRTFNHLAKLASLAKWSSVRLGTKSLWDRVPL